MIRDLPEQSTSLRTSAICEYVKRAVKAMLRSSDWRPKLLSAEMQSLSSSTSRVPRKSVQMSCRLGKATRVSVLARTDGATGAISSEPRLVTREGSEGLRSDNDGLVGEATTAAVKMPKTGDQPQIRAWPLVSSMRKSVSSAILLISRSVEPVGPLIMSCA